MVEESSRRWVDSMPDAYERGLVAAVFEPFATRLAARVAERRPDRVLELAAGTGVLTRELVRVLPSSTLVATDLNDAMVAFGARQVPQAEWRSADAMSLPFDDGAFDVVVCQFGAMFFPNRVAAFREARRVTTTDGALIFNTWAEIERHGYEHALVQALRRVFPDNPPTFFESVPHGYSNPALIADDVSAAGFASVTVETVELSSRIARVADLAIGYCEGTPLRGELADRGDVSLLAAQVAVEMESILGGPGPASATMAAHEVVAIADAS